MLFKRGNAISGAPIIRGTNQLPKPPISAGIIMKNTMIRPWVVTKTLKVCGLEKICMPGSCSSMRTPTESAPMSLWLVENSQRLTKLGWPWLAWSNAAYAICCLACSAHRIVRRHHRRAIGRRRVFLLGLLDPGVKRLLAHHAHRDRHESMIAAAQFRALTVEHPLDGGLEPGLVEAAGNGVDFDTEGRHREGMDDAVAGHLHTHDLVHRHHHLV